MVLHNDKSMSEAIEKSIKAYPARNHHDPKDFRDLEASHQLKLDIFLILLIVCKFVEA